MGSQLEPTDSHGNATTRVVSVANRDDFLAHRQRLLDARQRAQQRLDQLVVTGASGALVLSLTFLEKIAPSPRPSTRCLLGIAWGLLLGALLASLLSHAASAKAFDQEMERLDLCYTNSQPLTTTRSIVDHATRWLNRITVLCFMLGMSALVCFAFINVPFQP
jgi:hypothetical protein